MRNLFLFLEKFEMFKNAAEGASNMCQARLGEV